MESKHTPGPQVAEPPNFDLEPGDSPKYHWTIHAPGKHPHISFEQAKISSLNGPAVESDLRLIAAAPELLDALKAILPDANYAVASLKAIGAETQ